MTITETAAYLRQYNRWRSNGNVDTELTMPDPHETGLHIDFAASVLESMAAHDHLMVIAATRYCLGRMTYIVADCADWLIKIWPLLSADTRNIIQRDIDEAFARDDEDREAGRQYTALGHDCDRAEWARVRALWSASK